MSSNKFNSDNSNILINQIDICFLKQNASPSIPIQIESINKYVLVDINWFNKGTEGAVQRWS